MPKSAPHRRGRLCSVRASVVPWLRRNAFASLASALSRQPMLPRPRRQRILRALPHCPRVAVRPPVCTRPSPSRLVTMSLTPLRLHENRPSVPCGARSSPKRTVGCCDDTSQQWQPPAAALCPRPRRACAAIQTRGAPRPTLSCRYALDIWAIMQQDYPSTDQESSACSGCLVLVSLDAPCELVRPKTPGTSTSGRAGAAARSVPSVTQDGRPQR